MQANPLSRHLSAFEIEAFFNFSDAERCVIEDRRGLRSISRWSID